MRKARLQMRDEMQEDMTESRGRGETCIGNSGRDYMVPLVQCESVRVREGLVEFMRELVE